MAQAQVTIDQFLRLSKRLDEIAQVVKGEVVLKVFPVGSLFLSLSEENPSRQIGGQWERYAKGCCLVGVDPNDADFARVGIPIGSKTVALTESQNGTHTHGQNLHNHSQNAHGHVCTELYHEFAGTGSNYSYVPRNTSSNVSASFVVSTVVATNNPAKAVNLPSGSDAAHNNIQPSVPVYIWLRIA